MIASPCLKPLAASCLLCDASQTLQLANVALLYLSLTPPTLEFYLKTTNSYRGYMISCLHTSVHSPFSSKNSFLPILPNLLTQQHLNFHVSLLSNPIVSISGSSDLFLLVPTHYDDISKMSDYTRL